MTNPLVKPYWATVTDEAEQQLKNAIANETTAKAQVKAAMQRVAFAKEQLRKSDPLNIETITAGSVLKLSEDSSTDFGGRTCTVIFVRVGTKRGYKLYWDGSPAAAPRGDVTGWWNTKADVQNFFRDHEAFYTRIS